MSPLPELIHPNSIHKIAMQPTPNINNSYSVAVGGSLPTDVINNILHRLPVKSLIRFKSVSKSWNADISTVRFAANHLQRARWNNNTKSWLHNQFLISGAGIGDLTGGHVQVELLGNLTSNAYSVVKFPQELPAYVFTICYADGLVVACTFYQSEERWTYVVWNPSTRTYIKFQCPYQFGRHSVYGLVYDQLIHDYKFVICDMVEYAIFFCRNYEWSEMKTVDESTFTLAHKIGLFNTFSQGIFSNGDFYWIVSDNRPPDTVDIGDYFPRIGFEVVCFDSREENFKRLPDLPSLRIMEPRGACFEACLFGSTGDNVCLFYDTMLIGETEGRIFMLERGCGSEYTWTDMQIPVPVTGATHDHAYPVFLASKDEMLILRAKKDSTWFWLSYDIRERRFTEIHRDLSIPVVQLNTYVAPFYDNMFFSSQDNGGRRVEMVRG